jgi:chromosomal replication initiation ATPase DnaA
MGAGAVKPYVNAVAEATGIPAGAFYGRGKKKKIAEARQLVMYLANRGGVSLSAIGRALNRDHTTVMHGVRVEAKRRGEVKFIHTGKVAVAVKRNDVLK